MKRLKKIANNVNVDTVKNDIENILHDIEYLRDDLSEICEFVGSTCDEFDSKDEYIDNSNCSAYDLYVDIDSNLSEIDKIYSILNKSKECIDTYKNYLTHKNRLEREEN